MAQERELSAHLVCPIRFEDRFTICVYSTLICREFSVPSPRMPSLIRPSALSIDTRYLQNFSGYGWFRTP